jgi:hypothetical protein
MEFSKTITVWLLVAFVIFGCSKYGKIEGTVLDKLTQKPVAGATVSVNGTTLSKTTNDAGKYVLTDVVPGVQKISVARDGYIQVGEVELTTAKGTTVSAANLYLIPKPPQVGLFNVNDGLEYIRRTSENDLDMTMSGNKLILAKKLWKVTAVDISFNCLLYEGDSPLKSSGMIISPMKFFQADRVSFGFFSVPQEARWLVQEAITQGIKTESLSNGLTLISGSLSPGRYCLQLKHELGVQDWYFIFDVRKIDKKQIEAFLQMLEQRYQKMQPSKVAIPDTSEGMHQWYKGYEAVEKDSELRKSLEIVSTMSKSEEIKAQFLFFRIVAANAGYSPSLSIKYIADSLSKNIKLFERCNDDLGIGYCKFNDMDTVRTIENSGRPLEYYFYPDEIDSAKKLIKLVKEYNEKK